MIAMQVIRSVSFEESDANSMRTISLDSPTIVDEISKMTSLQYIPLTFASTTRALRNSVKEPNGFITLESMKIFQQRVELRQSKNCWKV